MKKSQMKSKNVQQMKLNTYEETHFKISEFTLKCRQCEKEFYFNNKLHKHIRKKQHANKSKIAQITIISDDDEKKKFIIEFKRK